MPEILVEKSGPVARIVISHRERRNAMTYEMFVDISRVFDELSNDPVTRVIVLTGDGATFTAGGDISQFKELRTDSGSERNFVAAVDRALTAPTRCNKPVIASIRGICMGGGLQLAAGCDVRIAADDAVFRMPAARLGAGYRFEGIQRFVALIGASNTADLFFSARKFDAQEAMRLSFVNRTVAGADLDEVVQSYCELVAENAPLTISAAKVAIREALNDPGKRDTAALQTRIDACFGSYDQKEGRLAFMEKRKPQFLGR
ncbi:enoyl-CoA hydratase-related protein [Paraburkholderia sp. RL17-347-BIC-D]|uniref:enoyl-CoA hydratase-related protein n=1 Tax=Paraburkholderia sp. RL17-347-BIC-D TaxID=3031632 RepID=UPI0038BC9377